jgi:hypothetical protein
VGTGVDLTELQHVVGKYVDQYNLLVAAGPFTAATLTRTFITKNKLVSVAMTAGGVWFAIQELASPAVRLIDDQFGNLGAIFGMFKG